MRPPKGYVQLPKGYVTRAHFYHSFLDPRLRFYHLFYHFFTTFHHFLPLFTILPHLYHFFTTFLPLPEYFLPSPSLSPPEVRDRTNRPDDFYRSRGVVPGNSGGGKFYHFFTTFLPLFYHFYTTFVQSWRVVKFTTSGGFSLEM